MNKGFLRFLPALLFVITGIMAIMQERDYWEAASWFSFAVTVLIFSFKPATGHVSSKARNVAYLFMAIGIILLGLRIAGILPEPVRPLP